MNPKHPDPVDGNLFLALRAGFPDDLDAVAIETANANAPAHRYTWRDLDRGSAMIANLLAALELPAPVDGAAPLLLVQVEKSVEALMLYLAALRAGFVYVPLNSAYRHDEVAHFLQDARPAVAVCTGAAFGWFAPLAFRHGTHFVFTLDDDRRGSLLERASHHADVHAPVRRTGSDLAAILYTSGTTGRSKGAMLSHGNLLSNARVLHGLWGWRSDDVLVHALPLFHVHGLFVAAHGALLAGARTLWFARFEPRAVAARLPEATVFMGVPTLYVRLLAEPALTREACARMRIFLAGSAPLLPDTFEAWRTRTGHTIVERYGMSETLMLTSNPWHGGPSARRAGTVGHALPGTGVRVVDGPGRPCPAGTVGQVQVRGPSVFSGYWRLPEKTREEFTADGWFRTGDVGTLDAAGVLALVGRSKDVVITGGFNVYPAEVEAALNEQPGVAESAVIGVPHADFGEAVVAVVVPRPGATPDAQGLVAALKGRMAGFKVPKRVLVASELPRNAMGKVQKQLLRERHRELFANCPST